MSEKKSGSRFSRKVKASASWMLVGAVFIFVVVMVIRSALAAIAHLWWSLGLVAGVLALGGLAYVQSRFPPIKHWLEAASDRLLRLIFWFVLAAFPVLLVRYFADLVAVAPLPVAVVLLVCALALFSFLVLRVSSEPRRRSLWLSMRGVDRVTPFLYPFFIAYAAIVLFATFAFVLSDHDVIRFGTDPASPATISRPADALDFFAWHLLDSIPVLSVTETLRWKEPLGYTSGWVGLLLLVFKVLVIVPVIATFVAFWRYTREGAGSSPRTSVG